MKSRILGAMARAMFVDDWARGEDERGRRWPPGADLMDLAPPTPLAAVSAATIVAKRIEKLNGMTIQDLYEKARRARGRHLEEPTPERFGHYLAMQAMGHGVSWFDDHPSFPLKLPNIEYFDGDLSI